MLGSVESFRTGFQTGSIDSLRVRNLSVELAQWLADPDRTMSRELPRFVKYHVAVHADARPEFDIDFIDKPDSHMPDLGARGIGEIGITGGPAAVANAIFHATGKPRPRPADHARQTDVAKRLR